MNIILPTTQELEPTIHTIAFFMTIGANPAITFSSTLPIYYHNDFGLVAGKTYEVNALFNGSAWVIASIEIFIPPFFAKLTLNNGEVVDLEGSGALTSAMVSPYKSSVVNAEIGELCTSIGSAFYGCTGLTSIIIPNSVTNIGNSAFSNCTGLTSVIIGNSVTSIGDNAFYGCKSLTSITIPDTVTSIGPSAFDGCSNLTSITIPNSVTSIGSDAFRNCSGLTSVTIGNSVTYIGDTAFSNCTSLISITCNATTAPTIQSVTFYNVKTNGTLTVPSGSSGYNVWMRTGDYYLGKYGWTKVEQ